nr:hypothetical protein GCM10020093_107780 [Planobispora longispora]
MYGKRVIRQIPPGKSHQSGADLGYGLSVFKATLKGCGRHCPAHADVLQGEPHASFTAECLGDESRRCRARLNSFEPAFDVHVRALEEYAVLLGDELNSGREPFV